MAWWRQRNNGETVPVGGLYRRSRDSRMTELAEVLSVGKDDLGIPHVHFRVRFHRADLSATSADDRTLALSMFTQIYSERLPA